MNPKPTVPGKASRLAYPLVIGALTLIAAILRCWNLGQLGLTHFDEGIYATAGVWSLSTTGLGSIQPELIPYGPPGLPILIGLAYLLVGFSDFAAIAVVQVLGVLTVPVVAWVTTRTLGKEVGILAASLATFSFAHICFSRVVLTDVLFLLAWLVALGCGQRFLERPSSGRAIRLGLTVGLAQQAKYNGWLLGGIVLLTALYGLICDKESRKIRVWSRTFGFGFVAAMIAAIVVWPWYQFVDHHGGYAALLRHQRSYLGGVEEWPSHLRSQLLQATALSGSPFLSSYAWLVGGVAVWFVTRHWPRSAFGWVFPMLVGMGVVASPTAGWWLGLSLIAGLGRNQTPGRRLLGVSWLTMAALTPFYYPYARLWLPLHALGWIASADCAVGWIQRRREQEAAGLFPNRDNRFVWNRWRPEFCILVLVLIAVCAQSYWLRPGQILPDLLSRSDSVCLATRKFAEQLPSPQTRLRAFARPATTFYLSQSVNVQREPDLLSLAQRADPAAWAIYDAALESSNLFAETLPRALHQAWDVVDSVETELSPPALLDIHPEVAEKGGDVVRLRRARLWLLRPKQGRGTP